VIGNKKVYKNKNKTKWSTVRALNSTASTQYFVCSRWLGTRQVSQVWNGSKFSDVIPLHFTCNNTKYKLNVTDRCLLLTSAKQKQCQQPNNKYKSSGKMTA